MKPIVQRDLLSRPIPQTLPHLACVFLLEQDSLMSQIERLSPKRIMSVFFHRMNRIPCAKQMLDVVVMENVVDGVGQGYDITSAPIFRMPPLPIIAPDERQDWLSASIEYALNLSYEKEKQGLVTLKPVVVSVLDHGDTGDFVALWDEQERGVVLRLVLEEQAIGKSGSIAFFFQNLASDIEEMLLKGCSYV